MITIKHFLDTPQKQDAERIWVEPIGCTKDLREWCRIDHVLTHLGPPVELWKWYEEHPDGYEFFRSKYHEHLSRSPYRAALQALAGAAMKEDFTLLHQSDDSEHNTATALYDFLIELQAYCSPE
jgi:uncharacterized protein YeaO (DUF488 family)